LIGYNDYRECASYKKQQEENGMNLTETQKEKTKITREMVEEVFKSVKNIRKVGIAMKKAAAEEVYNACGMNKSTAHMHINNIECMLAGEEYHWIMKRADTEYYLNAIEQAYGVKRLKKALEAVKKHIDYIHGLGKTGVEDVEELYEAMSEHIDTVPWDS
jgi:adenosine/AMP kinase